MKPVSPPKIRQKEKKKQGTFASYCFKFNTSKGIRIIWFFNGLHNSNNQTKQPKQTDSNKNTNICYPKIFGYQLLIKI